MILSAILTYLPPSDDAYVLIMRRDENLAEQGGYQNGEAADTRYTGVSSSASDCEERFGREHIFLFETGNRRNRKSTQFHECPSDQEHAEVVQHIQLAARKLLKLN